MSPSSAPHVYLYQLRDTVMLTLALLKVIAHHFSLSSHSQDFSQVAMPSK